MIKAVTVNTNSLRAKLDTIPGFVRKTAFPAFAEEAKQEILDHTAKSQSPDGTAYPALTPQYARLKEKLVGHTNPNLRLKNQMLKSIGYRKSSRLLTVDDDQMKKAEGVSAKRRFLVATGAMVLRAMPVLGKRLQQFLHSGK